MAGMTKYEAETVETYPGRCWFTQKPILVTFETVAARTVNDSWRYSQYWTRPEWPRQALRDCDKRIEAVEKDLRALRTVREKLVEICADMDERENEERGEE